MEEEYGYFGEGERGMPFINPYREEVDMMLPIAESEQFTLP